MKKYETIYIVRPQAGEADLKEIAERLEKTIKTHKGQIVESRSMGRQSMAYRMEKEREGNYQFLQFQGAGEIVTELEKNLRFDERVVRFLTTVA